MNEDPDQLRERLERLQLLYEVSTVIHSTLDPQQALHLIVRDWLGSFSIPTAPGGCTTYPTDLTAATRMILVDCAQSAIQSTVATYAGEFVFNSAHSYRMGGVSWDYLGYQDDLFPDGWTVYTDLDPIVIP